MQTIWFGKKRGATIRLAGLGLALVALVLGMSSCQKEGDTGSAGVAPKVDSVASADGVMIHYETRGSGDRELVFVHCWSCDRCYWEEQLDEFSKDYQVVAVDLAGHGESGMGRETWSMEAYGADVAAVANKLGLKELILVGH